MLEGMDSVFAFVWKIDDVSALFGINSWFIIPHLIYGKNTFIVHRMWSGFVLNLIIGKSFYHTSPCVCLDICCFWVVCLKSRWLWQWSCISWLFWCTLKHTVESCFKSLFTCGWPLEWVLWNNTDSLPVICVVIELRGSKSWHWMEVCNIR